METPNKYSMDEVKGLLEKLDDSDTYGVVLRSKGMLPQEDGTWVPLLCKEKKKCLADRQQN